MYRHLVWAACIAVFAWTAPAATLEIGPGGDWATWWTKSFISRSIPVTRPSWIVMARPAEVFALPKEATVPLSAA